MIQRLVVVVVVFFSSKLEYSAVIYDLFLKGKAGKNIHSNLMNVYAFSATSHAQVKFSFEEVDLP